MRKLIVTVTFFACSLTHAAIVESGQRLSAEELAQQQAGCTLKSPEMQLAKACYSGDMDVTSNVRFIGTVGDDNKLRYCYNALVIPAKSGARSHVQVLRDNDSGQLRVQNFVVPPGGAVGKGGKTMVVGGVEGRCLTAAKIDGLSCGANPPLAISYSGTPGDAVSVDGLDVGAAGAKVTAENGDQDLGQIAKTLVTDIDRRLDLASSALISESESVKARGTTSEYLKRKAKSVQDCATAATAYRASKKLDQTDAVAEAQRRQIVDAAKRIQAGQPATAPGAPATTPGSAR